MLRSVTRRISVLEEAIRLPMTADAFWACAERHARRTGMSFEVAFESLVGALADDELARLASEFEQMAFGADTAARDAAKRRVLMVDAPRFEVSN